MLTIVGLRLTLVLAGIIPAVLAATALIRLTDFDADANRTRAALAPRVELLRTLRLLNGAD